MEHIRKKLVKDEQFLTRQQRYKPVTLVQDFSDEEMVRDWTLSDEDLREVSRYRFNSRLFIAVQLCAVRLYGAASCWRSTTCRREL